MLSQRLILGVVLALGLIGCTKGPTSVASKEIYLVPNDAEMNKAIEEARSTFPEFLKKAADVNSDGSAYMVHVHVKRGEKTENLLLSNVIPDGEGGYLGNVADDTKVFTDLKWGSEVRFNLGQVVDWEYVSDNKFIGAFTRRVERSRMTPEQRANYDANYPAFE